MGGQGALGLTCLSTESRSRQASAVSTPAGFNTPRRVDTANTITSLPPYSPPQGSYNELRLAQQQQPRAPADILGLRQHHEERGKHRERAERSESELKTGKYQYLLETDTEKSKVTQSPTHSPQMFKDSRAFQDPADQDEDISIKPLESRQGTETELIAGSPGSLGIFGITSRSPDTPRRTSTGPPSTASGNPCTPSSVESNEVGYRGTMTGIDPDSLEMALENLRGVKMWASALFRNYLGRD